MGNPHLECNETLQGIEKSIFWAQIQHFGLKIGIFDIGESIKAFLECLDFFQAIKPFNFG